MDLNKFIDYCLNNLLDKLTKESKTVFLLGAFNIDLLNYDKHSLTNDTHSLTRFTPILPVFSYAPASYCTTNKNEK